MTTVTSQEIAKFRSHLADDPQAITKQEAIVMFTTKWQERSMSLSYEDSKLWKEILASQSEQGFPDF